MVSWERGFTSILKRTTPRRPGTSQFHIEKWVHGGDGLARLEGRVALIPYVLPGETVRAAIESEKPGLIRARPVEIVTPAPERVEPGCRYFARCGGCQYQHAGYEFQLEQKRLILGEVMRRVGKIEPPEPIDVVAGPPWEYRNRVQLHLRGRDIGYLEGGSHRLCPIERCPISSPAINRALAALRPMLHQRRWPAFIRSIQLFTNETEVQMNVGETAGGARPARSFFDWCAGAIGGAAQPVIDYAAAGETYRVGHRSFFQVNRFLIDRLVRIAIEDAAGDSALDLYAGVGLFTLPLARKFGPVAAVESASSAHRDLEWNAARARLEVRAFRQHAGDYLAALDRAPAFLLADPPRAGLGPAVVDQLVRLKPARMAIVSCDPSTLARDLAPLVAAGYRLEKLTMVDLFPQTSHIESVARLQR